VISGVEPIISEDGVLPVDGTYPPTAVGEEGLADKLGIPLAYLRRLRVTLSPLFDENANGWFTHPQYGEKRVLLRALRGRGCAGGDGVLRAVLSQHYQSIDHLDALTAVLDGVQRAGAPIQIDGADLTDRRMYVRIRSEEVHALAPVLLRNYRSPFSGASGIDNPVVWAGFEISNSESGCGAFSIVPRLVVQVCGNGLTITKDAVKRVHLGGRLEDGVVRWSVATQRKAIDLIAARAADAVSTFLNVDYLRGRLEEIERDAAAPITDPTATIQAVARQQAYADAERDLILRHFIAGADLTAGGVLHAVTSAARTLPDADRSHELEAGGLAALHLAATV
jgi:hypothetical protein